jgi:hypothetical protein
MLLTAPSWSAIGSSPAFSAFSGVLAALMFAAMVLLLTREVQITSGGRVVDVATEPRTWIEKPLVFMFGSFFSLVVAAFLFAAMSGEEASASHTKQYVEGSLSAMVLSFGVVQTAVALSWLLAQRNQIGMPLELSRRIVDGTIVIAAFFLTGIALSPLGYHHPDWSGFVTTGIWLASGVLVAASVPIGWWGQRLAVESAGEDATRTRIPFPVGHKTIETRELDQIVRYVNLAAVGIAVVMAVIWNLTSGARDQTLGWLYEFPGSVLLIAYAALVFAWFAALESCLPKPNQESFLSWPGWILRARTAFEIRLRRLSP